jgi:predicted transcriptional regulator
MIAVQLVIFALIGTLTVAANPWYNYQKPVTTQAPRKWGNRNQYYNNQYYNNWYQTTQPVVKTTQAPVTTPEPVTTPDPVETFEQFKNQIPSAEELKELYIDAEKLTKEQIDYVNKVLIPALEKTAKDMPTVINKMAKEGIVDINAFNQEMAMRLDNAIDTLKNLDFEAIKVETIENVQKVGPASAKFIQELPENAKQMGTEFANQIPSQVDIKNNFAKLDLLTKQAVAKTSTKYRKEARKLQRNIDAFSKTLNSTLNKAIQLQQEKTAEFIQKRDQIKQEAKELVATLRENTNNRIERLSTQTNEAVAETMFKIRQEQANLKQQLCDYQRKIHEQLNMNPELAKLNLAEFDC